MFAGVNWDFPASSKSEGLHSIHPYPAKFIPEIPRALISILGVPAGTCVLDPFCGSGVTLVEAQRAGIAAVGVDLNPIACLISRVKTMPADPNLLSQANDVVQYAKALKQSPPVPPIPNLDHWFRKDAQDAIARLLDGINQLQTDQTSDALRLALSSILVRVSNQDSDTRYAAVEKSIDSDYVYDHYISALKRIWTVTQQSLFTQAPVAVLNKNIFDVTPTDIESPVGLVVTSPPYPNAYEYWLYHKYRMYWLGYDPLYVKRNEIGARAHYFQSNPPTELDFRNQVFSLLQFLDKVVVKSGHICIVIGRSKIHGKIIDNSALVQETAKEVGFNVIAVVPRTIASSRKSFNLSHANIKTEDIVILKK